MKTPKQEQFKEVMEFYRNSTPEQHQIFLTLISDKLTFYDEKGCYLADEDWQITFNGIYHQIKIK